MLVPKGTVLAIHHKYCVKQEGIVKAPMVDLIVLHLHLNTTARNFKRDVEWSNQSGKNIRKKIPPF
jgi:hypothetical protein